jgi:hypothetical protein
MKRLEDRVRPILIPLIKGEETRISTDSQTLIATWAVLKVVIGEHDERLPVTTHHAQRKYLMDRQLPPPKGWAVWIGSFEKSHWIPEWVSRPFLLLPDSVAARRQSREATYFNSGATTQILNKLFIHVIHSPHPRLFNLFPFTLPQGGTLFRVWPSSGISIKWPGGALSDKDAEFAAEAVANMVLEAGRRRLAEGEGSS